MAPKEALALGRALTTYLRTFVSCFAQVRSGEHFFVYCRGLLSDLPRKSVEPIALAAGTAVRTLQEFLRDHVWDFNQLRDQFQQRLAGRQQLAMADDLGNIGVIDETSVAKKGTKTPGVQRQYCGASGKIENCIVTVHLAVVRGLFKTLIDAALFLPRSWSDNRERCRQAAIPDDVVYRPKWRIALEELEQAETNGLSFQWLTFDEYYGGKPAFLEALETRPNTHYVAEIPRNFRCLTKRPRGSRPAKGWKGKRVDNLLRFSSEFNRQGWCGVSLARLTLDNQEWEVRSGQVYLVRKGDLTPRTYWLLMAHNLATSEKKYFLSNAPPETTVETLLRVAFSRWHVEHAFRVSKTELGFSHFEGRSYVALMRHLMMCIVTMGFVAEQTDRLRGKKSRDHVGASVPGSEPALPDLVPESTANDGVGLHCRSHCLSPAA